MRLASCGGVPSCIYRGYTREDKSAAIAGTELGKPTQNKAEASRPHSKSKHIKTVTTSNLTN